MKVILNIFRLMIKEKPALFFLSIILILGSSFLTIFQAEFGQAMYSALNIESQVSKSQEPVTKNDPVNIEQAQNPNKENKFISEFDYYVQLTKRVVKANSLKEGITLLLGSHRIKDIIFFGIGVLILFLIYELILYIQSYVLSSLGFSASISMQRQMFLKLLNLPSLYYKAEGKTGDLISRVMSDINSIRVAIIGIFHSIVFTPMILIFSLIMLFQKNLYFTIILLISGSFGFFIINIISRILKRTVYENSKKSAKTADYLNKTIYGIDIVKIFNKNKEEEQRFSEVLHQFKTSYLKRLMLSLLQKPLTEYIGAIILVLIILLGSLLLWNSRITMDEIIGFIMYLIIINPRIQELSKIVFSIKTAEGAAQRIDEILSMENESKFFGKEKIQDFSGEIEFDKVSFSYDKILPQKKDTGNPEHQLKEISVKLNKGEFIALVGPSGAGKSTFVNLIPALIYPSSGKILFDGKDYQEYDLNSIRKQISYVTQETILFPDTIYNNIAYGTNQTSMDEVIHYAELSNAHEFISQLPEGYDTLLGERGAKISGGQKQRIAIARALIKKPKILIFDEATSSLDSESEKLIQDSMEKIKNNQTTIVIAHRLSTILQANMILVLDKGKIVETGKHDELLNNKGLYSRLYYSQFQPNPGR